MKGRTVSRRAILAATPTREEHIASVVINCRPGDVPALRAALARLGGVEVHAESGGKLVATIESGSDAAIAERLAAIQGFDGVLSAALVFHYVEPAGRGPAGEGG